MLDTIYDKTDKGREEIASRKFGLSVKTRSLLLLIDGKTPANDLLAKLSSVGLDISRFDELIEGDFIGPKAVPEPEAQPALATSTPQAESNSATTESASAFREGMSDADRFQAVYRFYNESIKANLGFRGFTLQLKVEKAADMSDFEQLRIPFLKAVMKVCDRDTARKLRDRLDPLLYLGDIHLDSFIEVKKNAAE
ncbi:hypothetical protein [Undibacterium luofuense]|uniref:Uncharacterized protein n=1 Tax=Undibacterium luofuense TaxID=2828733 RepID=A0A941I6W4_9BURK|nr:hypothetical protein [Undibacterium luofuense]MBR7782020.1 hypothetical protein [Undibacterium luofuense]